MCVETASFYIFSRMLELIHERKNCWYTAGSGTPQRLGKFLPASRSNLLKENIKKENLHSETVGVYLQKLLLQ